jgi:hypothetical protein
MDGDRGICFQRMYQKLINLAPEAQCKLKHAQDGAVEKVHVFRKFCGTGFSLCWNCSAYNGYKHRLKPVPQNPLHPVHFFNSPKMRMPRFIEL